MISVNEQNCTGCRACEAICPSDCISFKENENGFLLPSVDAKKCIYCDMCSKTCPVEQTERNKPVKVYAAYSKKISLKSTSGGIFCVLAEQMLENGGIVYGTAFSDKLEAVTMRIDDINALPRLLGSKYVQGNTCRTYTQVRDDIRKGLRVLYSGTPCQIAGLKNYLRRMDTSNLVTVEVICHGVTSPKMFRDYIDWFEKRNRFRVRDFAFRAKLKENGRDFCLKVTNNTGNIRFMSGFTDPYYKMYMSSEWFRSVCYVCPFADEQRTADITLGDFWNAEVLPDRFGKDRRISVVVINSEKGEAFFSESRSRLVCTESSWEVAKAGNSNLYKPTAHGDRVKHYGEHNHDVSFFDDVSGMGKSLTKLAFNQLPMSIRRSIKRLGRKMKRIGKS